MANQFVGLGTVSPNYDLDVVGTIHASNIFTDGIGFTNTIGGITLSNTTLSAATVTAPTLSNVTRLNGWDLATSTVSGNFNIGTTAISKLTQAVSIGSGAAGDASGAGIVAMGFNATISANGDNINAFGSLAFSRGTGNNVNAMGYQTAYSNIGSDVNAMGYQAAYSNTGSDVTAIGYHAAFNNSGSSVFVVGMSAGYTNTGSQVIAIGKNAGASNTGSDVCFIGSKAGLNNSGGFVVALGFTAAGGNSGNNVNALGVTAGAENTGDDLNAVGNMAALGNTGDSVSAFGTSAAFGNTGDNVIAIGYSAGAKNIYSNCTFIGVNPDGQDPKSATSGATQPNTLLLYSTVSSAPTIQADTSNNYVGIGRVPGPYALDVSGTIRTNSSIVNTINVSLITSSTLTLAVANYATYFNMVYTGGSNITITLPGTSPIKGSYWVIKNNSPVNYTVTYTGGSVNVDGITSGYLQAGNGLTLIYSGSNSVYYTF